MVKKLMHELIENDEAYVKTDMRYFSKELLKDRKAVLNEYLYYFYYREQAVENILKAEQTRGEQIRDINKNMTAELSAMDIENDFEPKYITIRGKGELLAKLRKEVKKADKIYLATDPDREGEAISWHLSKALKLDEKNTSRITFNEITKNAVKQSIKNARNIDMDLVNAQQARRVLDRMVGYQISPVLWAKVKRGLSAGRVQSVALRIIADREEEINAFYS